MKILPISNSFIDYASSVMKELKEAGIRCEIDVRNEKFGYKIREARLDKVPYMLIVGQNEKDTSTISVNHLDQPVYYTLTLYHCLSFSFLCYKAIIHQIYSISHIRNKGLMRNYNKSPIIFFN